MVSPNITPEAGVGIYENDRTQGPACAVAAGLEPFIETTLLCVIDRLDNLPITKLIVWQILEQV
jgi:hypothetical protein